MCCVLNSLFFKDENYITVLCQYYYVISYVVCYTSVDVLICSNHCLLLYHEFGGYEEYAWSVERG